MENTEVNDFYDEIGKVCSRFSVSGLVGIWFSGNTDVYGKLTAYDVADTRMKTICERLAGVLEGWADGIHKGAVVHEVRTAVTDNNDKN